MRGHEQAEFETWWPRTGRKEGKSAAWAAWQARANRDDKMRRLNEKSEAPTAVPKEGEG